MMHGQQLLLLGAVAVVGVLHTLVPDHWVPIAVIARQRGWSKLETARAAMLAGSGHGLSTLFLAVVVWIAGTVIASHLSNLVDWISSAALIGLGGWVLIGGIRELRSTREQPFVHDHEAPFFSAGSKDTETHDSALAASDPLYIRSRDRTVDVLTHIHIHRHDRGARHIHWHYHTAETAHKITDATTLDPPLHHHTHKTTARTALLLILGSSPMVEGIPVFFAASKYGVTFLVVLAVIFAGSSIATYIGTTVFSAAALQRVNFGSFEQFGEVISGGFMSLVGVIFLFLAVVR